MEGAEGDFAMAVIGDRDRRGSAEVEIGAIPNVGLDDPPAIDQAAVGRAFTPRPPRASAARAKL